MKSYSKNKNSGNTGEKSKKGLAIERKNGMSACTTLAVKGLKEIIILNNQIRDI